MSRPPLASPVSFQTHPQRKRSIFDAARLSLLIILVAFAMTGLNKQASAQDQNQKGEPELRTVHGSVIDKAENPVPSSVVYLKNVKTQDVKTYIANDAGEYRFSGLDPNVDYEIHAEHNDLTSAIRTISSFDSRRDINLPLKLSHKKTDH
jgi:Carboxypeptidase regulatory-like domain